MRDNIKGGALTETTLLVLLAAHRPSHGYAMMQFIAEKTDGRVTLGAGTLYGAIRTLEKKRWIAPLDPAAQGARREYLITDLGREAVARETHRMTQLLALTRQLQGGDNR